LWIAASVLMASATKLGPDASPDELVIEASRLFRALFEVPRDERAATAFAFLDGPESSPLRPLMVAMARQLSEWELQ